MVIDEVRKAVGPRVPISLRLSVDELVEGGNTVEDCLEYLEYLNDEVDIYDTSAGLNASIQYQIDANYLEDGWRSYMAKAVRDKFGKPTIAIGNIRDPKIADDILARGDADLIGIGRGLIADPDWCNKAQYGDVCDIRKCISCNVGCVGNRIGGNKPLRCTINPDLINGEAYKKQKVNKPCNVVVVGAGTAGLEAACTAAEVGCNVFVLEKNDHIGGLSTFISDLPSKSRMKDFPKYLEARAARLKNLYIFLNTEATVDKIKQFKPDIIVNSTGSVPLVPPIKGLKENIERYRTIMNTMTQDTSTGLWNSKNRKISFKTDMSPIGSITIKERNDSIWMTTGRIIQSLQVSTKTSLTCSSRWPGKEPENLPLICCHLL